MSILPLFVLSKGPVGMQVGEGGGGERQQAQAPWRIQLQQQHLKRQKGQHAQVPLRAVHAFIASMRSNCVKGRSIGRDCADLLQVRDGNLGLSKMGSKMQIHTIQ